MPKIEAPTELASLIAQVDQLTADLNAKTQEFDSLVAKSTEHENKATELQTVVDALRTENDGLKEQLSTSDTARDSFEKAFDAEKAKAEALQTSLDTATAALEAKTKELDTAIAAADAATEVATEAEETKEAVQDQFAILAAALTPKGEIPDLVTAGDGEVNGVYSNWLKLSKSTRPEDKLAARKIYNQYQAELDAEISKKSAITAPTAAPAAAKPEDKLLYDQWVDICKQSRAALDAFNEIPAKDKHRVHSELRVQARKFYNKNKEAIDRCIAAY